jgi:hypothetical protein
MGGPGDTASGSRSDRRGCFRAGVEQQRIMEFAFHNQAPPVPSEAGRSGVRATQIRAIPRYR